MSLPSPDPRPAARGRLAKAGRWLVLVVVLTLVASAIVAGGAPELAEHVRARWHEIQAWVRANVVLALVLYFLAYVVVTGLSIPVANVLSIGAGALFGLWVGLALVSFGSTAGATLAFLGSRYLFRDLVRRRLGPRFEDINRNVERDGAWYLFTLRLMVVVPFWMVNLAAGLTKLRVGTFWWVSQLGMLPATVLYVQAGAAAGEITNWRDIFTIPVILSFALLGVVPLLLRAAVKGLRGDRA